MIRGALAGNLDVAQVVLYAFFAFFAGLVFYLRREDRREGYPLESEVSGSPRDRGFLLIPGPKIFRLADGETALAPRFDSDPREIKATKVAPWPGAPLTPLGDPMAAEVGPGAYALRADVPEKTYDGRDLIVPGRVATNYAVATAAETPVGMRVIGADRVFAGVVTDVWIDRSEAVVRYYEVEVAADGPANHILLPVTFARINSTGGIVEVQALYGHQIAFVPKTRAPDKVTLLEEEKIMAFFGAGTLYATAGRTEPLL